MQIGFIGLGVMGHPMAGHLAKAGHAVQVFNRSADKAKAWGADHGGTVHDSAVQAAEGCETVILCVGNDDDVRGLVADILPVMAKGAIIVDHTTTSAKLAKAMAISSAELGRSFLDAPVSGGQAGAVNGALTIMIGGDQAAYERAGPVLSAYAKAMAISAAELGRSFLDAPVSGGQAGAVNGALTIMIGGDQAAYDRAVPVL